MELEWTMTLEERLERIESKLDQLIGGRASEEFYSTAEVARMLGKAEFTIRTWCRQGRIKSQKRLSGRGSFPAWCVSQQEVRRYQREGLLPVKEVQPVTGLSK
jgi:hypothetical protein